MGLLQNSQKQSDKKPMPIAKVRISGHPDAINEILDCLSTVYVASDPSKPYENDDGTIRVYIDVFISTMTE